MFRCSSCRGSRSSPSAVGDVAWHARGDARGGRRRRGPRLASFLVEAAVGGGVAAATAAAPRRAPAPARASRSPRSSSSSPSTGSFCWRSSSNLCGGHVPPSVADRRGGAPAPVARGPAWCYLLRAPLRTRNVKKRKYKTNWRAGAAARTRKRALAAVCLRFVGGLVQPDGKASGLAVLARRRRFCGERYPCEKQKRVLVARPRRGGLRAASGEEVADGGRPAPMSTSCEDVWPFWYEKTEDGAGDPSPRGLSSIAC